MHIACNLFTQDAHTSDDNSTKSSATPQTRLAFQQCSVCVAEAPTKLPSCCSNCYDSSKLTDSAFSVLTTAQPHHQCLHVRLTTIDLLLVVLHCGHNFGSHQGQGSSSVCVASIMRHPARQITHELATHMLVITTGMCASVHEHRTHIACSFCDTDRTMPDTWPHLHCH